MKITELREILENIEEIDWAKALYFAVPSDYSLRARCSVLDPDESEEPEGETYKFAQDNKLSYCISIADVESILENARQQIGKVSLEKYHKAFLFYLENDAYYEFV